MSAITFSVTIEWWQLALIVFVWVVLGSFAQGFAEALWADVRRRRGSA